MWIIFMTLIGDKLKVVTSSKLPDINDLFTLDK